MTTAKTDGNTRTLLPHEVQSASAEWHCSDPRANTKNGRSALIWSDANRKFRPSIQLCMADDPAHIVEGVEASTGSPYMFIQNKPGTNDQIALLHYLDQYACNLAEYNCNAWFDKNLTKEQIRSMYRPLVNSETNTVSLRLSLQSCSVWHVSEERCRYSAGSLDDIAVGCRVLPCISVNGIYFKAREMGLSVTCTALVVFEAKQAMPFHLGDSYTCEEESHDAGGSLPEHEDCDATALMH